MEVSGSDSNPVGMDLADVLACHPKFLVFAP